jgi:hypothetical protein
MKPRVPTLPKAEDRGAARAARRVQLLAFCDDPPLAVLAAAEAVGRARREYAADTERELADIEAGSHPLGEG